MRIRLRSARQTFRAQQLIGGIYDIQRDGPSRMSDTAFSRARARARGRERNRENRTSVLFGEAGNLKLLGWI